MKPADILKISFEFSPKLGVRESPRIGPDHQSSVPGLYVVGDLADAPIIKVALNQGYEVARDIIDKIKVTTDDSPILDVVVVGAGPAGIGAGLALQEAGARFLILERERPFATIQNFPKAKRIFSEPREMQNRGNFWFQDAQKEELVERWDRALDERSLPIQQPEEVTDIQKEGDVFVVTTERDTHKARRVILAIGRRGAVRRLGIPGEDLDKVDYALRDPEEHRGKKLLVVGGGDSAVEAACSCADAGAEVTIVYRGTQFSRAKARNRQRIEALISAGKIRAELGKTPLIISESSVKLDDGQELENDQVLIFIGMKISRGFLKRVGIRMAGQMTAMRLAFILGFSCIVYGFYVLKNKAPYFPFGPEDALGWMHEALEVQIGSRVLNASFWGSTVYVLMVLLFGIIACRKYPLVQQKRRYVSLIFFQVVILFGIPEFVAPLIIDRPWKLYAITIPWPLSIWSVIDAPSWASGDTLTAALWIAAGLLAAFVAIPTYVRSQGERFCSYLCGCGGLAETLGDFWRHLSPRGKTSYQAEWFGRIIFFLAIPVTLMILNDAWTFITSDALTNTRAFAQHWYGLVVDFWLAAVIGVALYPYLGNRVWCRFFCPLRAWMEIIARRLARIQIEANSKCIGCGECTRYCQMGIDVQRFAQQQRNMHNGNSSCIQCGICIQVCPMEVLSIGKRDPGKNPGPLLGPSLGPG